MSIVSLLRSEPNQTVERREFSMSRWVRYLDNIFGGSYESSAGVNITIDTALSVTAVYACVRILSDAIATIPLNLHRRLPNRKNEIAEDHPVQRLLHDQPNRWQSSYDFRSFVQSCILLRGDGYSYIQRNRRGNIDALISMHPDRVELKTDSSGEHYYQFHNPSNNTIVDLQWQDVLHIHGFSLNGLTGIDPLQYHARAIGVAIAQEEHTARTFKNGATPSGILSHPMSLTKEAQDGLKKSWKEEHGGENRGNIAVLEEGMKFEAISMTSEDAQLIESRRYSVSDIARIYNVPLHMLAELERSTNNNIEHQGLEFVMLSLSPWFTRWEKVLKKDLLDPVRESDYYFKFNFRALLRGDHKSRGEYYSKLINIGAITPNEIREWEDMNPVDGGDVLMVPVNMTKLELLGQNTANAVEKQGKNGVDGGGNVVNGGENEAKDSDNGDGKEENSVKIGDNRGILPINNDENSDNSPSEMVENRESGDEIARKSQEFQRNLIVSALQPVFIEAAGRVIRKESQALKRFWKKSEGKIEEFNKSAEEFYVDHESFVRSVMAPCIESMARAMSGMNSADGADGINGHISINSYIENLSHRHVEDSKNELSKIILCEKIFNDLKNIDLWDESRANKLWESEIERLRNFIEVKTDA